MIVPKRTPENPLPEFPTSLMQEFDDQPEREVTGALAGSAHIEPRAPRYRKKAPLPKAPKEIE